MSTEASIASFGRGIGFPFRNLETSPFADVRF